MKIELLKNRSGKFRFKFTGTNARQDQILTKRYSFKAKDSTTNADPLVIRQIIELFKDDVTITPNILKAFEDHNSLIYKLHHPKKKELDKLTYYLKKHHIPN